MTMGNPARRVAVRPQRSSACREGIPDEHARQHSSFCLQRTAACRRRCRRTRWHRRRGPVLTSAVVPIRLCAIGFRRRRSASEAAGAGSIMPRARLRDLGLTVGALPTGAFNAITDVVGVKVGYCTLIRDTPRVVRTGITAIWPRGPEIWTDNVFAGTFSFNGNGEMTGLPWIAEQGILATPIGITNTYQVGLVRDAICALAVRDGAPQPFHLPVVAETYDGWLSDIASFPLREEDALAAFDAAKGGGPIEEGNVGGGTGMICHEFKGGTGTASRVVVEDRARYVVGALVQANYGERQLLRVDGVPVGREIGPDIVPAHRSGSAVAPQKTEGSIIV